MFLQVAINRITYMSYMMHLYGLGTTAGATRHSKRSSCS